jgi:methionyl-tRNA synthetase
MSLTIKQKEYPQWICGECGDKHGKRECGRATWHPNTCDVCGKTTSVTEPRDYGHLKETWKDSL